jgi:hypothetical protein
MTLDTSREQQLAKDATNSRAKFTSFAESTKADWDDMKALHVVFTRPVHYPQHPYILDYADRNGVLLVPEIPMWQFSEEQMKDPGYWTGQLGTLTYRDRRLDDIIGLRAAYEPLTAEQVRQAFSKYDTTESRMVFTVIPEAPAAAPAPAATPAAGAGAKP